MVTARWPQMIGVTLRGCSRTASSLWFLLLSLDLSAIAITLGCSSDGLHHRHTHDNSKEHSSLNDGFYSTLTESCTLTEALSSKRHKQKRITNKFPQKLAKHQRRIVSGDSWELSKCLECIFDRWGFLAAARIQRDVIRSDFRRSWGERYVSDNRSKSNDFKFRGDGNCVNTN